MKASYKLIGFSAFPWLIINQNAMETNLLKWHFYSHIPHKRTVSYSFHSSIVFFFNSFTVTHSYVFPFLFLFCPRGHICLTTWTNKVIIECNFTKFLASLLCWSSMFDDYRTFGKKNNIWPCHWTKLIGFGRWSIQKNRSLSSLKVPFLIILVLVPLS